MSCFDPQYASDWPTSWREVYREHPIPSKIAKKPITRVNYELYWGVSCGSRKAWIVGAKTTILIRRFLLETDDVIDLEINRLDSVEAIPTHLGHRHWINDVEIVHEWNTCDLNPKNFIYFS